MSTRAFASDNGAGVHPVVLAAIAAANVGHAPAYGDDAWTARAIAALRAAFDAEVEVLFTFGGTGANVVGLGALAQRWDAILCADSAHIWNSECAAPEHYFGGKLIPVPSDFGKLTPAALAPLLRPTRGVHHARPRVLSLTQPTEWGTLYGVEEMRELADFAHAHGLLLHVDGARFANAVAALARPLAESSTGAGIDVLSFGGTKNGLLAGEAVIIFDPRLAAEAAYARKQATQLPSKMRFIAAQFLAYMTDDLWLTLAAHANAMAHRLADRLSAIPAFELVCPADCNMLFPRLPPAALARLQREHHFHTWDEMRSIARWVTSFDTTPEDVEQFAQAVAHALAG